jgi:hypothetical protein
MVRKIFFAYESGHQENIDAIKKAIQEFNKHQKTYIASTWEDLGVSGKIISATVCSAINQCEIFACDMTYINHNVLFELGYAIGKKKKLLILLNNTVDGAVGNYSSFKIIKNVGFEPFTNYKQILASLQKGEKGEIILLNQLVNINEIRKDTHDILYIASKIETQASLDLTEMFKDSKYNIIFDNTAEVEYQTLIWYITNLLRVRSIVIHLLGTEKENYHYSNAESSLYAGLGCGLGKKVLLIAPSPFRAPIDYSDILLEYKSTEECVIKAEEWIDVNVETVLPESAYAITTAGVLEQRKFDLLKLGVGYVVAEEEKDSLLNYFIEIEAYKRAFDKKQSIFVGRKGTGKSAIFIKLENELELDNLNYNVILKPDSEELLANIEMSKLYNSTSSKRSFFRNVWNYVFFSKLLFTVIKKLKQQNKVFYDKAQVGYRLHEFYALHKDWLELNFFGIIRKINEKIEGKSLIENPNILADLNQIVLKPLKNLLREYFSDKKYYDINILADNLDKAWKAEENLDLQSEMILSLIELSNKLITDIKSGKTDEAKVHTVIFLRKDIFDYIMRVAREPDKLLTKSYEIDWHKHPVLLRKLIEKRFEYILNIDDSNSIANVWRNYFDINGQKHPFDRIVDIISIRPRDMIYFMSRLFESAVDNDHPRVDRQDLSYAIEAYTNFLHINLIAEMKAEFPNIEEIMIKLQESYGQKIQYKDMIGLLKEYNYDASGIDVFLNSLFNKGYIIGINQRNDEIIRDLKTLKKKVKNIISTSEMYVKSKRKWGLGIK